MNTKNLLKVLVVMLLGMTIVLGSCKKEESTPDPTPAPYVPSFNVISQNSGTGLIGFAIICATDDFTFTKLIVTAPTTEEFTYPGAGGIVVKGQQTPVPNIFNRISGTWTFQITGTISGGTNAGVGFTATTSASVSAK